MLRTLGIQRIAIGAGLLVVGVGAFALGRSMSDTLAPAPVVVEQREPAADAPKKRKKKPSTERDGQAAQVTEAAGEDAASPARTQPTTEGATKTARSTQSDTSPVEQTAGEAPRPGNAESAGLAASAEPTPKPRRPQPEVQPNSGPDAQAAAPVAPASADPIPAAQQASVSPPTSPAQSASPVVEKAPVARPAAPAPAVAVAAPARPAPTQSAPVQAAPAQAEPIHPAAPADAAAPPSADLATLNADLENAIQANAAADALAILSKMAEGSMSRGDYAAAKRAYNDALEIAHSGQLNEQRADQYANLGKLHWKEGNKSEAEAYWRAARDQYEQFELPKKVAEMDALLRKASPNAMNSTYRPIASGKRSSSIIELR